MNPADEVIVAGCAEALVSPYQHPDPVFTTRSNPLNVPKFSRLPNPGAQKKHWPHSSHPTTRREFAHIHFEEVCMKTTTGENADDRIVVGYFTNGADASRAISELIDEGFRPAEIGAAYCTQGTAMEVTAGGRTRPIPENPATTGSVGGPASHDQAVTPAGLAPGSGNTFAAPAQPGPIPGAEIPSTLPHDLPREIPSLLPHESEIERGPVASSVSARTEVSPTDTMQAHQERREHMRRVFDESAESAAAKRNSAMKFGTGEGHLFPDYEFSEPNFENSFLGMGLSSRDARSLSAELRRGGAIVSVASTSRASLAEGILQRNHGVIRFESLTGGAPEAEGQQVEIYGRMRNYYRPDEGLRRKAS